MRQQLGQHYKKSNWLLRNASKILLSISGWQIKTADFQFPKKAIVIAGPHTSNWDAYYAILVVLAYGIDIKIMIKHSLYFWPATYFWRAIGVFPVNRKEPIDLVDKLADMIADSKQILLALAPEGTRKFRPKWKTGFLRIAYKTQTPIFMATFDYTHKTLHIGKQLQLTNDIDFDLLQAQNYILSYKGKKPEKQLTID